MPKLHLKRTPAEEHERARRKAYKAAKRAAKRKLASSSKHADESCPSSSSHKPDYDATRAELEETEFREKMRGAFEDDEHLGGIDARFNEYAHIPDRWARDAHDAADPQYMDDDEYAEWIRQGMWKKKHAREYEEQAKRDAQRAAQKAREKEIKAETSRIEGLAREQEGRKARERQRLGEEDHRQRYEQRWKALLDPRTPDLGPLTFADIPWPLFSTMRRPLRMEDITPEAITTFLLLDIDGAATPTKNDHCSRRNRDKLKETLLRFHPDKFEGRFMHRVPASDTEVVKEAVGQLARVLNVLMSGHS
ncbi:hypothetical protein JVT61DRAFT_569 [Boletus reticuloceps]|uniref:Uncharacterized protein n=1 Tax=Boletus reticuloceps TaxID=495285 RepID=A0A8I2Z1A3_9AGAM|nr:hypothetical protein JVT61DRAFT_569 [Boletus reticuloceps]